MKQFDLAWYNVQYFFLNASRMGVPQERGGDFYFERVFGLIPRGHQRCSKKSNRYWEHEKPWNWFMIKFTKRQWKWSIKVYFVLTKSIIQIYFLGI
jgi:hypothetical protein